MTSVTTAAAAVEYRDHCRALGVRVNAWLAAHATALLHDAIVDVSDSYCGATGLRAATTLLARNAHLHTLRARHCALDDDAVVQLCRALRASVTCVRTSDDDNNNDDDLASSPPPRPPPPLHTIDVADNAALSLAAGMALLSLAQHCRTLVCVELRGTRVPDALQRRLARALSANASHIAQQQQQQQAGDDDVCALRARRRLASQQSWAAREAAALAALRAQLSRSHTTTTAAAASATSRVQPPLADAETGWRVLELPVLAAPSLFVSEVALLCALVLPRLNAQLRRHKLHVLACAEDADVASVATSLSLPCASCTACAPRTTTTTTTRHDTRMSSRAPRVDAVHAVPACDVLADVLRSRCMAFAVEFVGDRAGDVALPPTPAVHDERDSNVHSNNDGNDTTTTTTTTTTPAWQPVLYTAHDAVAQRTPWLLLATRVCTRRLRDLPPSLGALLSDEPDVAMTAASSCTTDTCCCRCNVQPTYARVAAAAAATTPHDGCCRCQRVCGNAVVDVMPGDGGDDVWVRDASSSSSSYANAAAHAWRRHVTYRDAVIAAATATASSGAGAVMPALCIRDYAARFAGVDGSRGTVRLTQLDDLAAALYARLRLLCLSLCGVDVATTAATNEEQQQQDDDDDDDDERLHAELRAQRERACALRDAALARACRRHDRNIDGNDDDDDDETTACVRDTAARVVQHVSAYLTAPRSRTVLVLHERNDDDDDDNDTRDVVVAAVVHWCAQQQRQLQTTTPPPLLLPCATTTTTTSSPAAGVRVAYVSCAAHADVHEVVQSLLRQLCGDDDAVLYYAHVEQNTTRLCRFAALLLAGRCALAAEAQRNARARATADAFDDDDDDDGEGSTAAAAAGDDDGSDDDEDAHAAYDAAVTAALATAQVTSAAAATRGSRDRDGFTDATDAATTIVVLDCVDALTTTTAADDRRSSSRRDDDDDDDTAARRVLRFLPVCLARDVRVCVRCRSDGAALRALRQRGRDSVTLCRVDDDNDGGESRDDNNSCTRDDNNDATVARVRVRAAVSRALRRRAQSAVTEHAAAALRRALATPRHHYNDDDDKTQSEMSNKDDNDDTQPPLLALLCDKAAAQPREYVRYVVDALCGYYEVAHYATTPMALLRGYADTLAAAARDVYAACVRVCRGRARAHVALGVLSCARHGLLRCELRTLLRLSPRRLNALLRVLRPALSPTAYDDDVDGVGGGNGVDDRCSNVLLCAVRLTSPALRAMLAQMYVERAQQQQQQPLAGVSSQRNDGKATTAAAAAQAADERTWHAMLAQYYRDVLHHCHATTTTATTTAFERRAIVALPYHLACAHAWATFDADVLSLPFVERVFYTGAAHAYARDVTAALRARCRDAVAEQCGNNNASSSSSSFALGRLRAYVRFVRRHSTRLLTRPPLVLQTAIECRHDDDDDGDKTLQREAMACAAQRTAAAAAAHDATPVYIRHTLPSSSSLLLLTRLHVGRVNVVCFGARGRDVCISAGDDRTLSWLQRSTTSCPTRDNATTTTTMTTTTSAVVAAPSSSSSSWSLRQLGPLSSSSAVCRVCFAPTSCYLATVSRARDVTVYDAATRQLVSRVDGRVFAAPIADVAFTSRGRRLCVATDDVRVRVYATETAALRCTLDDACLLPSSCHNSSDDNDNDEAADDHTPSPPSPRARRRVHDTRNSVYVCADAADEEVLVTLINAHVCVWRLPLSSCHAAVCCARARLHDVTTVRQLRIDDDDKDDRCSNGDGRRGVWVLPGRAHTVALYALPSATSSDNNNNDNGTHDDVVVQHAQLRCTLPPAYNRQRDDDNSRNNDERVTATTFALARGCDGAVTRVAVALRDGRVALYVVSRSSSPSHATSSSTTMTTRALAAPHGNDNDNGNRHSDTRALYVTCVYDAYVHSTRHALRDVAFACWPHQSGHCSSGSRRDGACVLVALGGDRQLRMWRVRDDDDGEQTSRVSPRRVRRVDGAFVARHAITAWAVAPTRARNNNDNNNDDDDAADLVVGDDHGAVTLLSFWSPATTTTTTEAS